MVECCGDTKEERAREGQKVITKFRLKRPLEHTYENCHNATWRRKCVKDVYNKAIDEFAEKLKNNLTNKYKHLLQIDINGFARLTTETVETHIDNVIEQLRRGNIND